MSFWSVAVHAPLREALTYQAAEDLEEKIQPGDSILVPLGRRSCGGVVIEKLSEPPQGIKLKNIISLNTENPRLSIQHLKWARFLADYYLYPLGQVLESFFPPLKRSSKGKSRKKSIFHLA